MRADLRASPGPVNALGPAQERALEAVADDRKRPLFGELIRHTDRFACPDLAERYEAAFESNA